MIISLVTALVILLSGGPDELFLIPKADKKIKTVIVDDNRKTEALELFKKTKKEIKHFNKELNNDIKRLKNDTYRASLEDGDVVQLLEDALAKWKDHQSYLVQQRLALREIMTEDEWSDFMALSSDYFEAKDKKMQKSLAKKDKRTNKLTNKMRASFKKNIADPSNLESALEQYEMLESLISKKFDEVNNFTFPGNDILHNYNATSAELLSAYNVKNEVRENVYNSFLEFRAELLQFLPAAEWNDISKSFLVLL